MTARSADLYAAGVTKRQFTHWVEKGYIVPLEKKIAHGGLAFDSEEVEHAHRMAILVNTFGFEPSMACRYSRQMSGAFGTVLTFDLERQTVSVT